MSAPFWSRRTTSSLSPAAHAARNTQSAENLILRAICRGWAGSLFVSDCSQRLSCSALLKRAELERVSRDIVPVDLGSEPLHDRTSPIIPPLSHYVDDYENLTGGTEKKKKKKLITKKPHKNSRVSRCRSDVCVCVSTMCPGGWDGETHSQHRAIASLLAPSVLASAADSTSAHT